MDPSQNTSLEYTTLIKTEFERRVFEDFKKWLVEVRQKWIVLKRVGKDKLPYDCRDILVLPYGTRFREKYFNRVLARFADNLVFMRERHFVHVVLTVRCKDRYFDTKMIWKNWNRLRTLLRKRVGYFEYFAVLEPHKSGFPHLHILIFTDKFLIWQKELSRIWYNYGMGKIVWLRRYWARRWKKRPLFYLYKYLSKYAKITRTSKLGVLLFCAFLWYTKTRTYTCSRFFLSLVRKERKEKEYEFVGVFFAVELKVWLETFVRFDHRVDDFLRKVN